MNETSPSSKFLLSPKILWISTTNPFTYPSFIPTHIIHFFSPQLPTKNTLKLWHLASKFTELASIVLVNTSAKPPYISPLVGSTKRSASTQAWSTSTACFPKESPQDQSKWSMQVVNIFFFKCGQFRGLIVLQCPTVIIVGAYIRFLMKITAADECTA